jgi:Tfp pilus assembly protein PilN
VNAPPAPEDAARLEARATEYVRLAGETDDPAVKRDRLRQAAQARIASGRMLEAIAAAIPSPPPAWGLPITYGGGRPARGVLAGPRPR